MVLQAPPHILTHEALPIEGEGGMIEIKLTLEELMIAAQVGSIRRVSGIKSGMDKNKHTSKSDWGTDIDGAAAEMAFAKWLGVYWAGSNRTFKAPDVGSWQVRSTTHREGCLIVRPNDSDRDSFVLILTATPSFFIAGWLMGSDAKQDKFRRDDSWWVPQNELKPLIAEAA